MEHIIDWVEIVKSKNGNEYKKATIGGQTVSVWPDFPQYLAVGPGAKIKGQIVRKGNYTNLVADTTPRPYSGARGASQGMITKAMETKKESIEHFTDKKELGIKISSTMRMAVDCAISNLGNKQFQPLEMENLIIYYRKWLWMHWDAKDEDFEPFLDRNPYSDPNAELEIISQEEVDSNG